MEAHLSLVSWIFSLFFGFLGFFGIFQKFFEDLEDFGKIRGKGKVLEVQGEAEVQGVSGNRFCFYFFCFFGKNILKNFMKTAKMEELPGCS